MQFFHFLEVLSFVLCDIGIDNMRYGHEWRTYVPVGQKKAKARKFADKLAKKQKRDRRPIEIEGRKIARSFWGKAWCDHLESLSDYANRLPRGATYVRNGSVVDLVIKPGKVNAIVAGSDPYEISISIDKLNKKTWNNIKKDCSSAIDSLIDLLGGRMSDGVMRRLTDMKSGCFPSAGQIELDCSCPDWSVCCKHIAAVMYAIGSRLDSEPELLFLLRGVDQQELISQAVSKENLDQELAAGLSDLANEDLGAIFGIDLDSPTEAEGATSPSKTKSASRTTKRRRKVAAKKAVAKKKPVSKKTSKKTVKKAVKKKTATASTKKKTGIKNKSVAVKKSARKKISRKQTAPQKTAIKTSGATKNSRKTKNTSAQKSRAMKTGIKKTSAKPISRKSGTRKTVY